MDLRILPIIIFLLVNCSSFDQYPTAENEFDRKIKAFLENNAENWSDMNVPISDGKLLYDLIVKNNYKNAVEIGTSTGHSAIWIAWALSKNGGKLTTIEIDKSRFLQAKANFKKAGVEKFIDVVLGDAHEIAPSLKGNYDFVFCDADKYWYVNYFLAMDQKLVVGGCYTAHNTSSQMQGIKEFTEYVAQLKNYKTTFEKSSNSGISISYKEKESQ